MVWRTKTHKTLKLGDENADFYNKGPKLHFSKNNGQKAHLSQKEINVSSLLVYFSISVIIYHIIALANNW